MLIRVDGRRRTRAETGLRGTSPDWTWEMLAAINIQSSRLDRWTHQYMEGMPEGLFSSSIQQRRVFTPDEIIISVIIVCLNLHTSL